MNAGLGIGEFFAGRIVSKRGDGLPMAALRGAGDGHEFHERGTNWGKSGMATVRGLASGPGSGRVGQAGSGSLRRGRLPEKLVEMLALTCFLSPPGEEFTWANCSII